MATQRVSLAKTVLSDATISSSKVARRKGMHEPRLIARLAKGPLHGAMVRAGHLDSDDGILQAVLLTGVLQLQRRRVQLEWRFLNS